MEESNFKYRLKDCEHLDVGGSVQWLDTDDFLKRNPKMKRLHLEDLPGEQINDLLKQWINGEGIDLKNMLFFNSTGYPDDVIFDGIVTMETKLTEEQAKHMFGDWDVGGITVDIQRQIDGQVATVHINSEGCFIEKWSEERLDEL
ncbi:hypothetical protein B9Z55_015571 [Caenorhabditis nigoni]|uniref:F-box associated domain-containing protein n=1 Tax=Caenorhabditis nigoni TaxID=1611254 RepID=A0A2G5UAV8_9PELO|nr:hypothetical protein B9Z55_015571 [Caenorhabditis nigoni]